jgi:predicted RNase H-like nuclease (RuvC/YqgF family)
MALELNEFDDPNDQQVSTLSKAVQELQMENATLKTQLMELRRGMQRIIDNLSAPEDVAKRGPSRY